MSLYPFYYKSPWGRAEFLISNEDDAARYFPWVLSLERFIELRKDNWESYIANYEFPKASELAAREFCTRTQGELWSKRRDEILFSFFVQNVTRQLNEVPAWAQKVIDEIGVKE
jgi:hypothetical protein